ncbi:MAG: N4-gp56 family major capsid protein [bacterium]
MAQNLAAKYQKTIDEVFRINSVTDIIINKGIRLDYEGVNAVTIYGVATVAETAYTRSGSNRFGSLLELDTTKQTFTLSQDRAFTYSIDRGNYEDSAMVTEAGSTLQRQIEVVCVPNTDIYRLAALTTYAVANSQSTTVALSSSNVYIQFLSRQATLDDAKVPADGRVAFVTPATYALLKQDTNFIKASEMAQDMLRKGVVGDVDGVTIVKVPTSYLAANTGFLIVHNSVLVAPHKFDTFRILKEVQGIDGWVVEGRRYYDAFIPTNHGIALALHKIA